MYDAVLKFTRLLSVLQNAGMPLLRSLKALEDDTPKGEFKDALNTVIGDVEKKATLSEALAKHPEAFDTVYIAMVKAGEAGGALEVILPRVESYLETKGKGEMHRSLHTLGLLISTGVPILEALSIAKACCKFENNIGLYQRAFDSVREGNTIAEVFRESGFIPTVISELVDVGEDTGDLDTMLIHAAHLYERELVK